MSGEHSSALPPGRIDIHSHLLPGIDDGCIDLDQSLACVVRLQDAGYVGSICTPHIWPERYPDNTPANIVRDVDELRTCFRSRGIDYRIWPGGELRLFPGVVPWMQKHGVPTLADSRCVLMDFWEPRWPAVVDETVDWLLGEGYQPILAHPERTVTEDDYLGHLDDITARGVWLQGNFRCFTGGDGIMAEHFVRDLMTRGRYDLLALDMHGPDTLGERLTGFGLAVEAFGQAAIDHLTRDQPRRLILEEGAGGLGARG